MNAPSPEGKVRMGRFLLVTAPATAACLGVVACIALGWVSVSLATVRPLELATSEGTAESLDLSLGTDASVTGLLVAREPRAVAVMQVRRGDLHDLCLVPRITLPVVGELGSLRIATGRHVVLGTVALAATKGSLGGIDLPVTVIGGASGEDLAPGAFSARTVPGTGDVRLEEMSLQAYGLVLEDGIDMRSLTLRPALGDQAC